MLRTALKPTWIAGLILALVVSGVFVLLGKWQMDNAASAPPPLTQTETPVPLTEHFVPEKAMYGTEADQVVTLSGQFLPDTDVFVHPRLNDGEEGYWVVTALRVQGAPQDEVIPVVRGWTASTAASDPAPEGEIHLTGRLLPAEGPGPEGIEQTPDGTVLASLASAELINLWDVRSYAGYVAPFEMTAASGAEVGATAAGSSLEPVIVGPQPQETTYNWMNIFYAIEWVVFAGFAIYLWWRFLRDDHLRQQEEAALDRQWAEEWKAAELERRRAQAVEAKRKATEEYERYHGVSVAASPPPASPQQAQPSQQTHPSQEPQ
ncbi:SURF1 family protein [Citricoccus sp. I39-566]|uniref:SURF1 family protein n=1 Tax=Citricoccus sp. I39-566 TaxID=3073268 RepID=UPI00286BC031|nr:SURF1 family protein [Citricoccus sp. I39-566]WMY77920.1 SURF1 family protein [Citricoccus sp. I39-566]